jgi:hypothetical protein
MPSFAPAGLGRRLGATIVLAISLLVLGSADGGQAAPSAPDEVAILNSAFPGTGLLVRPRSVPIDNHDSLLRLRWRAWGKRTARATGRASIDTCLPSCADGSGEAFRVRVTARAIRRCTVNLIDDSGNDVATDARVYTRVRFRFVGRRPRRPEFRFDWPRVNELPQPCR